MAVKTINVKSSVAETTEIYEVDEVTGVETLIRKLHKCADHTRDEHYTSGKLIKVVLLHPTPDGAILVDDSNCAGVIA
ncbi:hypothetical protein X848_gp17 [Edwardsiella phage PEi21]|uniref:Uncharacterized protein n=1 Tax=Edwardsiella phage PEi21 TaxID=1325372 RepID=N0DU79_9CAUD|nr:hypothetical protein X848_gp17 [Edwardsiella phage PEi21]BAN16827.1 hypothetical protein [Edwardsiella phage PEi21]